MDAARRAFGANAPGGSARTPPAVPGAKNGVPDLSAFLNAVRADGSPDFASMARASGMDPRAFQAHAESLWSEMDALAGDPAAYRARFSKRRRATPASTPSGAGAGAEAIFVSEKKRKKLLRKKPTGKRVPGTEKRRGWPEPTRRARRFWRRRRLRGDATKTTTAAAFAATTSASGWSRCVARARVPRGTHSGTVGVDERRRGRWEDGHTRRKHKRRRRRLRIRAAARSPGAHEERRRRARREGGASGPASIRGTRRRGIRRWRRWRRRRERRRRWTRLCTTWRRTRTRSRARWRTPRTRRR